MFIDLIPLRVSKGGLKVDQQNVMTLERGPLVLVISLTSNLEQVPCPEQAFGHSAAAKATKERATIVLNMISMLTSKL